ncbi:hypothetical protein DVH24_035418 [Malus domestica]|uniref:Uncharacterized protein n=1 Tax=Malus domestica TaxID=3750 RepID=A0A498J939_MALDO|nr:hypothetical protein DVH24_035418 [Malus domestica]
MVLVAWGLVLRVPEIGFVGSLIHFGAVGFRIYSVFVLGGVYFRCSRRRLPDCSLFDVQIRCSWCFGLLKGLPLEISFQSIWVRYGGKAGGAVAWTVPFAILVDHRYPSYRYDPHWATELLTVFSVWGFAPTSAGVPRLCHLCT